MVKKDLRKVGSTSRKNKRDKPEGYVSSSLEDELESKLADVSFEERLKARCNGFVTVRRKIKQVRCGRANKNRPMEINSKEYASSFREPIKVRKREMRDPRFESLCGDLDMDRFRKKYSSLFEVELPAQKEELKKLLKKTNDRDVIADLKNHISLIDKQLKVGSSKSSRHAAEKAILAEHRRKERDAAKQGKHPFYSKESEVRRESLIQMFHSVQAAGTLESVIEKKRRKNALKERRFMPYRKTH